MTEVTLGDIQHLADLSRLSLSDEEKRKFSSQLPKIVEFVEELGKAKISENKDEQPTIALNDLRQDEISSEHLSLEQLKELAPKWTNNHVEVPAIFGVTVDGGDDD